MTLALATCYHRCGSKHRHSFFWFHQPSCWTVKLPISMVLCAIFCHDRSWSRIHCEASQKYEPVSSGCTALIFITYKSSPATPFLFSSVISPSSYRFLYKRPGTTPISLSMEIISLTVLTSPPASLPKRFPNMMDRWVSCSDWMPAEHVSVNSAPSGMGCPVSERE